MNKLFIQVIALYSIMTLSPFIYAHEGNQHIKKAEMPRCEEMKGMHHEKMQNDPVMKAMMKKCNSHIQNDKKKNSSLNDKELGSEKSKHTESHNH